LHIWERERGRGGDDDEDDIAKFSDFLFLFDFDLVLLLLLPANTWHIKKYEWLCLKQLLQYLLNFSKIEQI
jgi:hypothetical protein